MRLEKASHKAIKYACFNFHYAKRVPLVQCGYSVFNDKGEWCGVICYSIGANNKLFQPYGIKPGQGAELVRIALNKKQENVSKVISISVKLLQKDNPLLQLVCSFADTERNHVGTIYQASNWFYLGQSIPSEEYFYKGKRWHGRAFRKTNGSHLNYLSNGLKVIMGSVKHRYLYPLDKSLIPLCKSLSKPYPKKCDNSITANAVSDQLTEDGQHDLVAQKKE